jgi:hypothetical protein
MLMAVRVKKPGARPVQLKSNIGGLSSTAELPYWYTFLSRSCLYCKEWLCYQLVLGKTLSRPLPYGT